MNLNSRKNFLNYEYLEPRLTLSASWSWRQPRILSSSNYFIKEDTVTPIKFTVVDIDSKNLRTTINVSGGTLLINGKSGVSLTIAGSQSEINKSLKSLKYKPLENSNKQETLTINSSDGVHQSTFKSKINIIPVNDAPTIFSNNVILLKNNNVIWDNLFNDIDSKNIFVSLESNAKIQINDDASVSIKNSGNKVELKGELSKINQIFAAVGRLKITPSNKNDISLSIIVSDGQLKTNKNILISQKENLVENATNAILSRLEDKNPDVAKPIFSIKDHRNKIYVRNPNGWAYDLDLTSISPWNSAGGDRLAGTLISPRHIVFATHYQMPIGTTIRFITKDNIIIERTLINKMSSPYTGMYYPDITVGLLDYDVPSSIGFSKILPTNWNQYIDNNKINVYANPGNKVPCLVLDQEEKALVSGLFNVDCQGYTLFESSGSDSYNKFFENIIPGDSGNPAFIVINNELVLLTIWTFGGGGSGTFITSQKNSINQMMISLGGGYELTEINLGNFAKIL